MLFLLLACHKGSVDSGPAPDLTERLETGEVRAGVVTDERALFGGISAEGRLGDIKIYNDRVQFVIQQPGTSSFAVDEAVGVIDADLVRPDGVPGRDVIDDLGTMVGFGRLLAADDVRVESDGKDGAAVVTMTAHGSPLGLLVGATENADIVPERDFEATTTFTLQPDAWLLEIETHVVWHDTSTPIQVADLGLVSDDVSEAYRKGAGLDSEGADLYPWSAVVGRRNEAALGLLSGDEDFAPGAGIDILGFLGPVLTSSGESIVAEEGDELTFTRYLGVAPDLGTLTGAWRDARGLESQAISGTVTADGSPVAGARVHVLDASGAPLTMLVTKEDGTYAGSVDPEATTLVATGRGRAERAALPAGAGWYGPYAAEPLREEAITSIAQGAPAIPFAEGYGISATTSLETAPTLVAPGFIGVTVSDGLPTVARVDFLHGDPVKADERLVPSRPGDDVMSLLFLPKGEGTLEVEPGEYQVVLHRGARAEPVVVQVTVGSGEIVPVTATSLEPAYALEGVVVGDPHSHAAPSTDGGISMEDRLVVHAASGIAVHFGTDHDHIVDYRPLLEPLGLTGRLESVVADEVSSVMRGHFNVYPLEEVPDASNHGAWPWWRNLLDTDAMLEALHALGEDSLVQMNHPSDGGMLAAADYVPGEVGDPDRWSDDFDAMEVINRRDIDENFLYYLDLTARGYAPSPSGASDCHTYRSECGQAMTYYEMPDGFSYDALRDAVRRQATVVSTGPWLEVTAEGAWAPGRTYTNAATLSVTVHAPSWMPVETVNVWENGTLLSSTPVVGSAPTYTVEPIVLAPAADAVYVITTESVATTGVVYADRRVWAMASAIRIDVGGDGWTAPLPPLVFH